jgi:hypothetical protein
MAFALARLGTGHQFKHNSPARSGLVALDSSSCDIVVLMDKIGVAPFIFMISAYKKIEVETRREER